MTSSVVATITTTFHPAPNDLSAIGYFSDVGGSIATVSCSASYAFTVSRSSGICCHTASRDLCVWNNRCSGSVILWEDGTSSTCSNNNLCVTTTLFAQETSADWTAKMAWCMVDGIPDTLYRTFTGTQLTLVAADSITTSSDDSEPTSTTTRDPFPTSTETTLTTTTSSTTTIDPSELPSQRTDEPKPDNGGGTNTGAIAGGVVGGVAGLVLIALAVWFIMRRQKKKTAEMREIGAGYTAPDPK
ncbi:hypothetical protein BJY01DRAFT_219947 [Aspergillus pseudoustus]|uniref:Epidermal growth factor receptor-like transmembrane-juxtamembrane segment domain-containing protein n=1 Tax=Aspergillus pseudoustus TaxID=1810923 RepID=A0ABR4JEV6_9EURO